MRHLCQEETDGANNTSKTGGLETKGSGTVGVSGRGLSGLGGKHARRGGGHGRVGVRRWARAGQGGGAVGADVRGRDDALDGARRCAGRVDGNVSGVGGNGKGREGEGGELHRVDGGRPRGIQLATGQTESQEGCGFALTLRRAVVRAGAMQICAARLYSWRMCS